MLLLLRPSIRLLESPTQHRLGGDNHRAAATSIPTVAAADAGDGGGDGASAGGTLCCSRGDTSSGAQKSGS